MFVGDSNVANLKAEDILNGQNLIAIGADESSGPLIEETIEKYSSIADMAPVQTNELIQTQDRTVEPTAKNAGIMLTGADRKLYEILDRHIDGISNGTIRATGIEVDAEDLGLGFHWTASDLGVDEILVDGLFAEGVTDKLVEKEHVDLQKVADAVYLDNPESVYWIDKSGPGISSKINIKSAFENGEYVCFQKSLYIEFPVTDDSRDRDLNDPEVSWQAIDKAKKTRENALAIVARCSNLNDRDKLIAYQEEICKSVEYCTEVNSSDYGDEWQMTGVFDDNPETNVVCEGYSKAFQYLCNQTEWQGDVRCYSIPGEIIDGSSTPAPHMWNIVIIDGQKYIADITNSDEDSVGDDGSLFLTQPNNGNILSGYDFGKGANKVHYDYSENILSLFDCSILELCNVNT